MNILIGADPEIFVRNNEGKLISAHKMIPGTKKEPYKVEKGAVQVDGMALEFNIDAASTADVFCENVQHVMAQMRKMIDHEFAIIPVAHFGKEYMKTQPEEALELGCDPDFNAWIGEENPRPNGDRDFRTAAGHVHIGWKDPSLSLFGSMFESARMARQMDFFLGLPSLFFDPDTVRRELYGKAGAFRPKPYGMEYRVLSNAWLTSSSLIEWVFRAAHEGARQLLEDNHDLADDFGGDIQSIINQSRKDDALAIIHRYNLEVPVATA